LSSQGTKSSTSKKEEKNNKKELNKEQTNFFFPESPDAAVLAPAKKLTKRELHNLQIEEMFARMTPAAKEVHDNFQSLFLTTQITDNLKNVAFIEKHENACKGLANVPHDVGTLKEHRQHHYDVASPDNAYIKVWGVNLWDIQAKYDDTALFLATKKKHVDQSGESRPAPRRMFTSLEEIEKRRQENAAGPKDPMEKQKLIIAQYEAQQAAKLQKLAN
jgi:hypothetical protein